MLTDEFLDMCYNEYVSRKTRIDFHRYVEKRLADVYKPFTQTKKP
jgi:hypothetical protein